MPVRNSSGIHLLHPVHDCTLCGDADKRGIDLAGQPAWQHADEPVNCLICLAIMRACVEYLHQRISG
jgi:hypothetical protein